MTTMRRKLVLLCLSGLLACGCGSGRKPVFPITGKVLVNGKPAAHAMVVFHPVGENGPDVVKPRGKVETDGSFTLTTYDGNDGAPAGDYQVTVEQWLSSGKADEGPSNRLPARYAKPDTSGLTAKVNPTPNTLEPFALKR